jgi:HlyD family secretion protein
VVQGVVTYMAVLTIDNAEMLLRPGMTATAEIKTQEVTDALLVPNAALRYTSTETNGGDQRSLLQRLMPGPPRFRAASDQEAKGCQRTIYLLREGAPVAVPVEIGVTDGSKTQIVKADLRPDDQIIIDQRTARK